MSLQQNKYQLILNGLKDKIRQARFKAALTANAQLLAIYWEVGQAIIQQENEEGWGAKTVERLSVDLRTEFEDMKGLSVRNLRYMREFAKAYPQFSILQQPAAQLELNKNDETPILQPAVAKLPKTKKPNTQVDILQPLVAKIPWTHNQIKFDKVKEKKSLFYVCKSTENGKQIVASLT